MFRVVTVDEARRKLLSLLPPFPAGKEKVDLASCPGRVTAGDIHSPAEVPSFSRSTVDGFAVRASETFGASESIPSMLALAEPIPMGRPAAAPLPAGHAAPIATGGVLPEGADAVVMVEHAETLDERTVAVTRPVAPGANVLQRGEEVTAGEMLFPRGHLLRPADLGVLASAGMTVVEVFARPRVAVLSTGDEIVPVEIEPTPGKVRDVNGWTLSALAGEDGGRPERRGIVADRYEDLKVALEEALEADLVLVSGGSSVGARDLTARAVAALGHPGVLAHGLALRPGKPTLVALVRGKPVIALPGHPVSALVAYYLLARPALRRLQGWDPTADNGQEWRWCWNGRVRARVGRSLASVPGREDYVPARLVPEEDELRAVPVLGKSGSISTMARAHGLLHIPLDREGVEAGEEGYVYLF